MISAFEMNDFCFIFSSFVFMTLKCHENDFKNKEHKADVY